MKWISLNSLWRTTIKGKQLPETKSVILLLYLQFLVEGDKTILVVDCDDFCFFALNASMTFAPDFMATLTHSPYKIFPFVIVLLPWFTLYSLAWICKNFNFQFLWIWKLLRPLDFLLLQWCFQNRFLIWVNDPNLKQMRGSLLF